MYIKYYWYPLILIYKYFTKNLWNCNLTLLVLLAAIVSLMANWGAVRLCRHLPALPLHARHPQVLPAGVQQAHLFPDLGVLLLAQVPLPQQGGAGTEDAAHAALVGG